MEPRRMRPLLVRRLLWKEWREQRWKLGFGCLLLAAFALVGLRSRAVADEAVLTDEGPGTGSARPGLTRLLGLVAEGRAAALITYTLDRLARNGSTLQETLLRELRRRELPIYVAKVPRGYRYDPATGQLMHDPAEVAEANREDWRPPKYIVIPVDEP